MLKMLTISNLAVIRHLQVEFRQGLNIISGETGAGKSIILTSLRLLLGERASQDILRSGESRAYAEGVFDIQGNHPLKSLLLDAGIEIDEDELIIKREILATGRGKVFVNNQAATLNLLKQIQPHIIDVHGQGDQQSLLSPATQTSMLDSYAKNSAQKSKVITLYDQASEIISEIDSLKKSEAERLQFIDLLNFQISEIGNAAIREGEDLELINERTLLTNSGKLSKLCAEVLNFLYDDDQAVVTLLGITDKRLSELGFIDPVFRNLQEQIQSARYLIDDIVFTVRDYIEKISFSPNRFQVVEERLELLEKLKRKYGNSLKNIVDHYDGLLAKREDLKNSEELLLKCEQQLSAVAMEYSLFANELSSLRKDAAKSLEKKLRKELSAVALDKAQFRIYFNNPPVGIKISTLNLNDSEENKTMSRYGNEIAEYYFSANPGEELKPLSAVASGGELSRLMLILKTNIAPTPYPRSLVFDEIDTGIGGKVADGVGERLRKLAELNQVICVTHQAQIARYADHHLRVQKSVKGDRTITSIQVLSREGRVEELARMLAGSDITEITIKHAEELLAF